MIKQLLDGLGIPYAYDHFAEGEAPPVPYICYLYPGSDNFGADDKTYYKVSWIRIELYTDKKSPETETQIEDALDNEGIFYNKNEVYITDEKLYEVSYEFEGGSYA